MDGASIHKGTTDVRDLPELLDQKGSELALSFPSGSIDRVVAAVAARQSVHSVLQEKIDGCWCAMKIGDDGRVASVTSRSGLHLRLAVAWIGEKLPSYLRQMTLIGEVEAGTHHASLERGAEEDEGGDARIPRFHVYSGLDRAGRELNINRVRQIARRLSHPRIGYVREAGAREDWGGFAKKVLEDGGEGLIIREGACIYRAKPRLTCDRYVPKVERRPDRHGTMRLFAVLSVFNGRVFRRVQRVLVPEGMTAADLRERVAVVVGASVDLKTGVIRHARIADIRPRGEKTARECVI